MHRAPAGRRARRVRVGLGRPIAPRAPTSRSTGSPPRGPPSSPPTRTTRLRSRPRATHPRWTSPARWSATGPARPAPGCSSAPPPTVCLARRGSAGHVRTGRDPGRCRVRRGVRRPAARDDQGIDLAASPGRREGRAERLVRDPGLAAARVPARATRTLTRDPRALRSIGLGGTCDVPAPEDERRGHDEHRGVDDQSRDREQRAAGELDVRIWAHSSVVAMFSTQRYCATPGRRPSDHAFDHRDPGEHRRPARTRCSDPAWPARRPAPRRSM